MGYCPAIRDSCQYFEFNKCQMRHPRIGKTGNSYFCRSNIMSKEVKDLGAMRAISEGPKFES